VALDRLHGLDHAVKLLVAREHNERGVGARLAGVGLEAARDEDLVMLLADFSVAAMSASCSALPVLKKTHLIAGGAPAGINILPDELGCLTNSTRIRMTTMHGNSSTTPRGTEMAEFPFSLSGRLR